MYRPLSPTFDVPVPDLPTLRRMKPLPKRRRTSDHVPHKDDGVATLPSSQQHPEESSGGTLTAETQDPALAAQTALQEYYMPVLGGVRDLFKPAPAEDGQSRTSTPISIDLNAALAVAGLGPGGGAGMGTGVTAGGGQDEDEDGGEGDYVDHLQQPGNTKKRKVPANMSGSGGHDAGSGGSGAEDDVLDSFVGRERDADLLVAALGSGGGGGTGSVQLALVGKKGRLSRATLAGLHHKETLKSRRRQVASVLEALTHDTLALDQALSASRVFVPPGTEPRVRASRRLGSRTTWASKSHKKLDSQGKHDENKPPSSDFTFVWHSATSDRLVATREEVAILHSRFEAELVRQAVKAAEAAKQAAAAAALIGPLAKRTDRTKQVARTANTTDQKGTLEQSLLGNKSKGGKKKKRSALANASNPHHLRNYVPSRLPHSGPPSTQQSVQNAQNLLTPLPLRFLSAEMPPRRRKKSEPKVKPVSTLTNPVDEWICPFCEYELFYGDEQSYHRGVRNRKKILRRRRRARERAAAAASGVAPGAAGATENDDVGGGFDTSASKKTVPKESTGTLGGKQTKWKEGDRGGGGLGVGV